ncbi:hypothetical protein RvY_07058-1 [Ramazzottius varieornatus]|uniref:Uncharacterized protein n=1 Tax=Ramazzottius varieornatus TaxID=947166 RepID=A0A1D1V119_RAMVA|nr:hypothetical protein RvY_07058-1 [Ramazzottius varieornatus]
MPEARSHQRPPAVNSDNFEKPFHFSDAPVYPAAVRLLFFKCLGHRREIVALSLPRYEFEMFVCFDDAMSGKLLGPSDTKNPNQLKKITVCVHKRYSLRRKSRLNDEIQYAPDESAYKGRHAFGASSIPGAIFHRNEGRAGEIDGCPANFPPARQ